MTFFILVEIDGTKENQRRLNNVSTWFVKERRSPLLRTIVREENQKSLDTITLMYPFCSVEQTFKMAGQEMVTEGDC